MTIGWRTMMLGSLFAVVAAGCVNLGPGTLEIPRFYVLSSMTERHPNTQRRQSTPPVSVAVGPVSVPQHLNRPQMVTRPAPNRIQISELDQWAEPLPDNITRVLAENLSLLLGTDRVYTFPWDSAAVVDIQVSVDIVRLDAGPDGTAWLEARWTLHDRDLKSPDVRRATRVKVPLQGEGAEALASAQSTALARLSRDIAEELSGRTR